MVTRILPLILAFAAMGFAQKYDGPRPEKSDLPYLKHGDNLVATEPSDAKEEKRKEDTLYVMERPNCGARTPLPSPILLFQADKIQPEKLALYKLEVKNGRREILFSPKKKQSAMPIRIEVNRLSSDNLYKIEVEDSLSNGEYALSPEGSNQVFCFEVY